MSDRFSLAHLDACEADIGRAEQVLAALDDGTFGRCARCGDAIDEADLAADPLRLECLGCRVG